jgi:hypothetical protein
MVLFRRIGLRKRPIPGKRWDGKHVNQIAYESDDPVFGTLVSEVT